MRAESEIVWRILFSIDVEYFLMRLWSPSSNDVSWPTEILVFEAFCCDEWSISPLDFPRWSVEWFEAK